MINLTTRAVEKSTYAISVSFFDENGVAVTPKSVLWTLTDLAGMVVNGREQVVAVPALAVDIVLSGNDLALGTDTKQQRLVVIEATYDSTLGNDLPLNESIVFPIDPVVYVS